MRDQTGKRAALIASASIFVMLAAWPTAIAAAPDDDEFWWGEPTVAASVATPPRVSVGKPRPKRLKRPRKRIARTVDTIPPIPPGQLHVVVSIDAQRATLFADGAPIASADIATGTPSHPTPLGIFTVIQKRRHHVSNLYGAKMPYMQRLTWSGIALHEGPLPGYPASHGCIRLPKDFAQLLWKATRIGARVIVTRDRVAPVAIAQPMPIAPAPAMVETQPPVAPAAMRQSEPLVRTADATSKIPGAVVRDVTRPVRAAPAAHAPSPEQATKLTIDGREAMALVGPPNPTPHRTVATASATVSAASAAVTARSIEGSAEPIAPVAETATAPAASGMPRRSGPVSMFVSRRDGKLYVRHNMQPLFDVPIRIAEPERPIGTHVYTAMGEGKEGLRWTVVSIPSADPRRPAPETIQRRKKPRNTKAIEAAARDRGPPSTANEALERIDVPPDAKARLAPLLTPGSSLIVSDNRLSNETGKGTDFIVLTP